MICASSLRGARGSWPGSWSKTLFLVVKLICFTRLKRNREEEEAKEEEDMFMVQAVEGTRRRWFDFQSGNQSFTAELRGQTHSLA